MHDLKYKIYFYKEGEFLEMLEEIQRGADDFGFADDAAQDAEETAAEIFSSETLTDVQEETVLGQNKKPPKAIGLGRLLLCVAPFILK